MFRTSNCSSSGGLLYEQSTVFHHASYEDSSCWHDRNIIIPTVSATRILTSRMV